MAQTQRFSARALQSDPAVQQYAPQVLSIVRIVVALLFLQHGLSRMFGFPSPMPPPALFSLHWFAGAIEFVGGLFALFGFYTRLAAFIMSGEMAFAYFLSHAPNSFFLILNRRPCGDPLLLRVPLHRLRRRRSVESRRVACRQAARLARFPR